jgi:hypothetical protein
MNLETYKRKAGETNNGNEQENESGEIRRQDKESDRTQKVSGTFLAGFGVRVKILDGEAWARRTRGSAAKIKCRRQQDGAEITVPANELIFVPGSSDADKPRELFQHKSRWRDLS